MPSGGDSGGRRARRISGVRWRWQRWLQMTAAAVQSDDGGGCRDGGKGRGKGISGGGLRRRGISGIR
ncbi:hypothetical protein E2562_039248 [Oryza meyeriana var. granulata]|uniref:Uncharacterized protein n=1 Tax=Oryza meyeriana var. granulata TaxID=110450 RepID=A0A6G1CZT2_9ORYZ|nr:hypothetical protein E2562_039248 [Oryza meyeriana var. granulata]